MSIKKRRIFISIMVLISLFIIAGCKMFPFTEKWKEEVQLSEGRVIVVDRETLKEGGGDEIVRNPTGTKPKEYRIRFSHPNGSGQIIEWRSAKRSRGTYPELPLILIMEANDPVIFSILSIDLVCKVYLKYKFQNGIWIEERLSEEFEKCTTNLSIRSVDMPKYVDLEAKRQGNASIKYISSYKQVGPKRKVCSQY